MIDNELQRFNVMACGRRFGKDVYMMNKAITAAVEGYPVAWGAPTYKMLTENWRAIINLISPVISRKSVQERQLQLSTGGILDFWSLDKPETIRGRKYKRFVINEAGEVPNLLDVWNSIIRPTLVDLKGDGIIGGTPKGRNGFWSLYQRGRDPENDAWACWQKPSYENPHVPKSEIDDMVETLPQRVVDQEVYAKFLEGEGVVFRNIAACMIAQPVDPKKHKGHRVVMGTDWGKQNDFTANAVGCADCHVELALDRFNEIDWHFQRGRLKVMAEKWHVVQILAESNSIGEPQIEELARAGLPVRGFETTATSKPPLIENLALTLEREEWQFIDDPIWTAELEAYERKMSTITGRSQYSAPEGLHDDTVIARALMVKASERPYGIDMIGFAG